MCDSGGPGVRASVAVFHAVDERRVGASWVLARRVGVGQLEQPLGVATLRGTLFVAEPKRVHVFAPDGSPCKGCAPRWPGCVAHVGVHGDNLYLSDPLSMRVHRLAIRGA